MTSAGSRSPDRAAADAGPDGGPVLLPAAVRAKVVSWAATCLGTLPADQIPVGLRAFARFTPGKRARLAAGPIAAALESDVVFRQRVAEQVQVARAALVGALAEGGDQAGATLEELAAAAYVLRTPGWRERLIEVAGELTARADVVAGAVQGDVVRRLTEQLGALRSSARAEAERLRGEAEAARAEVLVVRRRVRELGDRVGRAEAGQRAAEQAVLEERAALAALQAGAREQVRSATAWLAVAEAALAAGRQNARDGRAADELRLRVLLDALLGAATGLRRELALPPAEGRPADALAATYAPGAAVGPALQGRDAADPALLDALLGVPLVHLLVDGYNVTKTGYGELALEAQRGRLLLGLGALTARTGAEVTVVFDGAERVTAVALPAPRGVRLLFSREGETADEVLRHLVRQEPRGRPLVVVSSDREVADGVRDAGARAVPSLTLLRLLGRS